MANPQIPDETVEAHTEEICSECGQAACATVMHETPDSVGTHSMDIGFRLVCPYCWMRPEVTRIPDEAAVTPPIDAITLSDRELLVRVMEALDAERAQNEVRYRLWDDAQAEVTRLREVLSAINAVPNRTATPLKKMRIMWEMALAALDKEGT